MCAPGLPRGYQPIYLSGRQVMIRLPAAAPRSGGSGWVVAAVHARNMHNTLRTADVACNGKHAAVSLISRLHECLQLPASGAHSAASSGLCCQRCCAGRLHTHCPVQGSYFNLTQEWLVRHQYPPGPIHLTRTHLPTLPIYYSVGNFKARLPDYCPHVCDSLGEQTMAEPLSSDAVGRRLPCKAGSHREGARGLPASEEPGP